MQHRCYIWVSSQISDFTHQRWFHTGFHHKSLKSHTNTDFTLISSQTSKVNHQHWFHQNSPNSYTNNDFTLGFCTSRYIHHTDITLNLVPLKFIHQHRFHIDSILSKYKVNQSLPNIELQDLKGWIMSWINGERIVSKMLSLYWKDNIPQRVFCNKTDSTLNH